VKSPLPRRTTPVWNKPIPDAQLIEIWLHGRSRHAQRAYAADVRRFCAFSGKRLSAVTLADLQKSADLLPDLHSAVVTGSSAVKSLLGFGYLTPNLLQRLSAFAF